MDLRLTNKRIGLTNLVEYVRGLLLKTGQTTCYHVGDDGDYEPGISKSYTVLNAGQYAGTSNIDVPHYANNGISFVAPNTVNDAGAGLVTFLNTDKVVIRGSALNDGVFDVLAGGVAGSFTTVQNTIVNEGAGPYVSICKRAAHSNNCVLDNRTGIMWSRYSSSAERVGPTSNGLLNWYDAATTFTLHPAAADLQMIPPSTLRVVGGAAELQRYHAGDVLDCAGFANAVNNLQGYRATSITVNGADLDITLWTCNNTLIAEAAAGARSISLVCRSIFGYAAAATAATLAGYSDWRVPNYVTLISIMRNEAPSNAPDAAVFPGWSTANFFWTSSVRTSLVANMLTLSYAYFASGNAAQNSTYLTALVRSGP
jgi:hypothetical protein